MAENAPNMDKLLFSWIEALHVLIHSIVSLWMIQISTGVIKWRALWNSILRNKVDLRLIGETRILGFPNFGPVLSSVRIFEVGGQKQISAEFITGQGLMLNVGLRILSVVAVNSGFWRDSNMPLAAQFKHLLGRQITQSRDQDGTDSWS
ncbi:hypothetical protein QL285_034371 [Trifolium repens]|nr:hypothetical protein QL285_034371 [Trifolium repens]